MSDAKKPVLRPRENGPLLVLGLSCLTNRHGALEATENMALCRCGASANKPFCDGSHKTAGFEAPGAAAPSGPPAEPGEAGTDPPETAPAAIHVAPNGPYLVTGGVDFEGIERPGGEAPRIALCRCGASANKPFCDGSHGRSCFEDPAN